MKEKEQVENVSLDAASDNVAEQLDTQNVTDSYNAKDAYRELFAAESEELLPEKSEVFDDDESESENTQADDTIEDADEPHADEDIPDLDSEIAKLSPDLQKRWTEQWAGILKRETRLDKREAEWTQVEGLVDWASKFDNPDVARQTYEDLGKRLAEFHGWQAGATQSNWDESSNEDNDFLLDSDRTIYERAKNDVLRELSPFIDELKALKSERAESAKQAQFNQFIDKIAPKTIKSLQSTDSGWTVTKEQVAEAIRELQGVKRYADDPASAVRAYFSDERARHLAEVSAKKVVKGPEMVKGKSSTGHVSISPENYNAIDAYRELGLMPE